VAENKALQAEDDDRLEGAAVLALQQVAPVLEAAATLRGNQSRRIEDGQGVDAQ
jgi:hypothetical protein